MGGPIHPRGYWRGVLTCARHARALDAMCGLLIRRGGSQLAAGLRLSQGSYTTGVGASAGTHDGCGVTDMSRWSAATGQLWTAAEWAEIVWCGRTVGLVMWHRTTAQGFDYAHAHQITYGCPSLSPSAATQVAQWLDGLNGLARRGADDGPRDYPGGPGTTVEDYLDRLSTTDTLTPIEGDDTMAITIEDLRTAIRAIIHEDLPGIVRAAIRKDPPTTDQIAAMYQLLLGRDPESIDALEAWVERAAGMGWDYWDTRTEIGRSVEARNWAITSGYDAYLGRTPTPAERQHWLNTGEPYDTILSHIVTSAEAITRRAA